MKLLETWYKCTGGSSDENSVAKFFLSFKHVLYRSESQFWASALFFTEGHIFVTVIATMLILDRHVYLG